MNIICGDVLILAVVIIDEQSAEYKHNRALFDDKARRCTERYAVQNSTERNVVSCRDTHQGQVISPQPTFLTHG